MNVTEQALQFDCAGCTLVGVLARPERPAAIGVVVIVGGPQYRAGSHRQFVALARRLAEAGHAVLRFDHRGMGDSEGEPRSFEALSDDIGAAIGALTAAVPEVRRVALWGLCDAASAALLYLDERRDPRVCGLALANPWVRSEAGLARAHVKHYYLARLGERAFWAKLLGGGVKLGALRGLWQNLRAARSAGRSGGAALSFRERMARAWGAFGGPILLLSSETDYTAREFDEHAAATPAWRQAMARTAAVRIDLAGADHTFSTPGSARQVETETLAWLGRLAAAATP